MRARLLVVSVAFVVGCSTTEGGPLPSPGPGSDASANADDASADATIADGAAPGLNLDAGLIKDTAGPDTACTGPVDGYSCCEGRLCTGWCAGPEGGPTRCTCYDVDGGCSLESGDWCCERAHGCANALQCAP